MFQSVLQSVAMVQTHRQDPVGDVFLLDMLRAHVRTQRMACAGDRDTRRLPRIGMGGIDKLLHRHGHELSCRTPLLPLPYETKRMGSYLLFAVALYAGGMYVENIMGMWLTYAVRIVLLLIYVGVVCTFENVPVLSPFSVALLRR